MKISVSLVLLIVSAVMLCPRASGESPCAAVYRYDRAALDALARYYAVARARKTTIKDLRPVFDPLAKAMLVFRQSFEVGSEEDGDVDSKFSVCDPETRFLDYDADVQYLVASGRVNGGLSPEMLSAAVHFLKKAVAVSKKTGQTDTLLPETVEHLQQLYRQQHLSQPQDFTDAAADVDRLMSGTPPLDDTPTPEPTP